MLKSDYGDPVEEFEIQFIDGEDIDCELANAWHLYQSNIAPFFDAVEDWSHSQKTCFIIAVVECGCRFDPATDSPDEFEIEIYEFDCMRDFAAQFVEEEMLGEIPERLQSYIDNDAIARDLAIEYSETVIAGTRLIYRME